MITPASFIIHDLQHAISALKAAGQMDIPVILVSAPGAARTGGAGWWRAMIAQARAAVPPANTDAKPTSILDCADEPGTALAAIREGVDAIAVAVPEPDFARLADIAGQSGVAILSVDRDAACDLAGSNDPQADCENHLRKLSAGVAKPRALG